MSAKRNKSLKRKINTANAKAIEGISSLSNDVKVIYRHSPFITSIAGAKFPTGLQQLDLSGTGIVSLDGVELPTGLQQLILSETKLTTLEGVVLPQSLTTLDLNYSTLAGLSGALLPQGMRQLFLKNTRLLTLEGIKFPQGLKQLDLSGTKLISLEGATFPQGLQRLDLSGTNIANLDKAIFPKSLQRLDLNNTKLTQLPDSIQELKSMQTLDLCALQLKELPDWLPELGLPFTREIFGEGIRLHDTTVEGVDMSIFDHSQETILQWFEEYKLRKRESEWEQRIRKAATQIADRIQHELSAPAEDEAKPLNELKVVFLGDGEAGKTHTIARLLKNGEHVNDFRESSTPGIVIEDMTFELADRKVKVHFWDFGGQEILHSMHRMFLTERTLYVVVLNVREGNQEDRARYWLHNLKSFANGAPVLLVLNKMDMNKNASVNESDLRKLYPGLTEIIKLSTLKDSPDEFRKKFLDVLLGQVGSMDILSLPLTSAGRRVKERIQEMKESYIHGDVFRRFCNECGVIGTDNVRRDLLNTFGQLGVSFCYSGSASLEDYVVLRPDWITNAIYIILFNRMDAVKNGLVDHETIYKTLSSEDMEAVRRTVITARYKPFEVDYVLKVFRKFRLSFLVKDGEEFLPMLCDANTTDDAAKYENDPTTLEFRMHYEYLPNNVIHRLMVDRRNELDLQNVWLTGARFIYDNTGLSAVVKSEDKLIRIIVKKETLKGIQPQFYLDALKDDLVRISREMGLSVTGTEVVYKTDDKVAEFDYEDLIYAQEAGDTYIRSRIFGGKVPIADILKQSDHPADEARTRFIRALTNACVKLQDNRNYWLSRMNDDQRKTCEDDRTTYLRDMLSVEFICQDQHFTGDAVGGHRAGELDLDIRLEPDSHWTALEALNLGGAELANWGGHLDKLLKNYNQSGRTFLFHVGYLTCEETKFSGICTKFWEHMRTYMPNGMRVLSAREFPLNKPKHDAPAYIRAMECVYDCGCPITVYHYFVRMHP